MAKDKQKAISVNQIGSVSLILVFTVLCLTMFGVLSLTGASADEKLAVKNAERVQKYYVADGEAEERLKEVDKYIRKCGDTAVSVSQYEGLLQTEFGEGYDPQTEELTYSVDIDEEQSLVVKLQLDGFSAAKSDEKAYSIEKWVVINKEDYAIDDHMPVWQGEF